MIWQAVHAGFAYFQREAGYTRTGSHNTRVHGRETGQWHEADLAVAHWLQHTSRDGDMQLHVHSQIAHVARTATDGKWRAPDSLGYNEHIGAVAAIVSQHLEEALTAPVRPGMDRPRRRPRLRDQGHQRRDDARVLLPPRVDHRRPARPRRAVRAALRPQAPPSANSRSSRKPSNFKTRNPKHGALDVAQAHAGWADKLARTLGVSLASVAPSVWHAATGRATAHAPGAEATVLPELELARAAQKAVALAQQEKSTWTRADVIKYLGRVLPRTGLDPAAAAALLEDLADRALRSEFEPVTCLEAPEPAEVPRSLLRADGRSVYQRHGGIRYATRAQLVMEERMLAQARATDAPRLTRAQAAHALGAEPAQLDAALAGRADATQDTRTRTGLRTDQAAAALSVLTDGQRASVINAPAGSGKTRVLTDTGRAWAAAGLGPVVGITASQSARNTLAAGVPVSCNAAQFLGHLPGRRGARGPVETGPAPLLVIDEASTMPGPDLADLISYAQARDGKVILAGDTGQLQAVENGGGMSLLAAALGYVRLTEPVRFRSLGTASQPAAARRGHHRAGRLRPARPHLRGGTGADDGRRRGRLRRAGRRWHRHAADGRRSRAAPGTVPPHPRRPHRPGHRRSRARRPHRRRRPGQCGRPDHLHPQRPLSRGRGTRPGAGQRGPAPHRSHHRRRAGRAPRPGRRPAHRAAAVDRPYFRVLRLRRRRTRVRGHRSCRAGPDRAHRPGGDHRDRGPPARLRRADPRHRRQPRVRVHRVPEAG